MDYEGTDSHQDLGSGCSFLDAGDADKAAATEDVHLVCDKSLIS